MSRRRPGQQPEKTIVHPNDPSIKFIAKLPKGVDREQVNLLLLEHRTVRLVYDDKNEVTKDKNGGDQMYIDQFWPHAATIRNMKIHCARIEGVEDSDGSPMTGAKDSDFDVLFEPWLDCIVTEAEKTVRRAFGLHIIKEIGKDGFFDPDPTASSSAPS